MNIITQKVQLDVAGGTTMDAYVAWPEGTARTNESGSNQRQNDGMGSDERDDHTYPGIIVFQEAFGVNEYIRSVVDRFARAGYIAIAPELFHRIQLGGSGFEGSYTDMSLNAPHMEALTDEGLAADAGAAFAWLSGHGHLTPGAIAAVGFCMGGRTAFLANTMLPLRAAVSFYGARIAPSLVPLADTLRAPMLFFWGGLDTHIPVGQRMDIMNALDVHKKSYVNIVYSDAGHGFFCDARASYHPVSSEQAWPTVLKFLEVHGCGPNSTIEGMTNVDGSFS